ncbi:MAG: HEAT repeat domain-containing protein [Undibacterium sp.]|nr:HEAT repeat domain-containing protein [Opitutaceae bacterium]
MARFTRPHPAARAASVLTAFVLALLVASAARAVEMAVDKNAVVGKLKPMDRHAEADIKPASDEGLLALKRFKLPPGLTVSLWAAEPMLANPVAFNFDEKGRAFVSETYRYRSSVLDIRDYMWLLEDELANRTQDDFRAMILRRFGPEGVAELRKETERVRLVEDRDGSGHADTTSVYADGFNDEISGIASGVLPHNGTVYFTSIPSLWAMTGANKAETRKELSTGYGVRFNFTGHDMHGLAIGPDGKLYYSIGDRAAHVVTPTNTIANPDTGSIFRCDLDGSHVELFATGVRNPQDLLFTENGDLFTGDNDCDQGDMERLVHVVEGGDSGWRVGYQHAPMGNAGSWNRERLWLPRFPGQAANHLAPIANIEDGPSGITYYPGTGLNDSYRGTLFITTFVGNVSRSGIFAYKLKPNGASYAIDTAQRFLGGALPTDVKFGPDGRLYWSDWADGWPKSKRGRIYAISDPAHANDPVITETKVLIAADLTKKSVAELSSLLGHPDMRVRRAVQFELAARSADGLTALTAVAQKTDAAPYARLHAVWGLGQLAGKNPPALTAFAALATDPDAEVRAQSVKLLGDNHVAGAFPLLVTALADSSARVKFFAAQSLGKLRNHDATPALLAALKANDDADAYLRHALVMGLLGSDDHAALIAASTYESPAVRLGVLLTFRRLASPDVAKFLNDSDPYIVREAALAINDAPIPAAAPALAAFIAKPVADDAVMLRAINANFRLGTPAHAAALATYAARKDAPAALRAEALTQLALWPAPPQRDRIVGIFRPFEQKTRDAAVASAALAPVLPALLAVDTPERVQTAALKAAEKLEITAAADTFFAIVSDPAQTPAARAAALNGLKHFKDPRLAAAVKIASESDAADLRGAALPIVAGLSPDIAAPVIKNLLVNGTLAEQRTALEALTVLQHPTADALMVAQIERLNAGQVAAGAQLEVLEAATARATPPVLAALAQRDDVLAKTNDPLAAYRVALRGGNAKSGSEIFYNQPVMACVKCHAISGAGGAAGPELGDIGRKYPREYLLESIIKPNAHIAPGFDTVVVTLKKGGVQAGVVGKETATELTLNPVEGPPIVIAKTNIARRDAAPSSMPEIYGAILTKSEIRDVVEFLASQKANPTNAAEIPRALRDTRAEYEARADAKSAQ